MSFEMSPSPPLFRTVSIMLSSFVAAGIVSAALSVEPMVAYEFSLSIFEVGYLITASYLVGGLIGLGTCGPLSRWLGPARVEVAFLALILATLICGVAWNVPLVAFGRLLQGLAGTLTALFAMGFVAIEHPAEKRIGLLGIVLLVAAIGGFLGSLAGSILVAELSWRWCFLAMSPFGIVVLGVLWLSRKQAVGAPN